MVRKGDEIIDVIKYVDCRVKHLKLEREKVIYVLEKDKIQKALDKLRGRIEELNHLRTILNGDIKGNGKFEWRKWQYLKKKKDEINQEKGIEKKE